MIIGASGYVGRHLCEILSKKYTVFGTFFRHSMELNGECVFLDIRDKTSVFELLRQIRPQLIYHLAYDLKDLEGSIVRGTDNFLRAKQEICHDSRFVFLSTESVFNGKSGPFKEGDLPSPV